MRAEPALHITLSEQGEGNEYRSGLPITLPAASLSTNLFGEGVQAIRNRQHCVRRAGFDAAGRLTLDALATLGEFPAYLVGQPYVWFLQNVRHYTNYNCTVTVDRPATFYLLVDNRVNDYRDSSTYSDPVFGPPDTDWVLRDGWQRVNTGLSPQRAAENGGDYVGIDEGSNGTLNQFYAIFYRTLQRPGSVTLGTEFDGNIYCLVISTNQPAWVSEKPPAAQSGAH